MKNTEKTKEQLLQEIEQLKTKFSESESKSRLWLENSPVCTKIVDLDFNLQYMSSSGVKELKIDDITEFYGKPYPLHFYPDSFKIPMTNNLKKAKESGEIITQEASVVDIDGNELWFHSTIVPVNDDHGKLDYLMVVSLEITERKLATNSLKVQSEIMTNMSEAVILVRMKDGVIVYVNEEFEKLFAYKGAEMCGQHTSILNAPTDKSPDKTAQEILGILTKTGKWEGEIKNIKKNGMVFWCYARVSVFDHPDFGEVLISVHRDITDHKQVENKIVDQRNKLDRILEGTNAGTWDWSIPTGEVVFNERWAEIMGYSLEELKPVDINTWLNNVHPDDLPEANSMLDKLFNKTLDYLDIVFRQPHKNGNWVWVNARGKVVDWSEDGKPLRISGTHLDVSKQMQGQQELKKHREHLEETVKERTAEVDEKNKKLNDQMRVFVGREQKIRNLEMRLSAFEGK